MRLPFVILAMISVTLVGCASTRPPSRIGELLKDTQPWTVISSSDSVQPWTYLVPPDSIDAESGWAIISVKPVVSPKVRGTIADSVTAGRVKLFSDDPNDIPNYTIVEERWVRVTAYNSRRDQTDNSPWRTYNNHLVHDGIVAYNDESLPDGTLLMFPDVFGKKTFVIDDRMNSIYGLANMDIWTFHFRRAVAWGQKPMRVWILGDPPGEAPD